MKLQKNYILLSFATITFIVFSILLSILLFVTNGIFPGAIWDSISFIIVNIAACLLFMTAFGFIKQGNINLLYYKLIWMQDNLIILGFLGLGLGFVFMLLGMFVPPPPGVDPTAKLVGSLAIAMITVVYGFVGASVFYLIQKYYEFKDDHDGDDKLLIPKEGFQLHAVIYLIIFLVIILFASYRGSLDAGTSLKNIFTLDAIIFVICINIIFILLYKGNYLKLLRNIFWYSSESETIIQYNIKFIRSMKKITSIIISIILIITPIVLLASFGIPPEEHKFGWGESASVVFIKVVTYYIYMILMIIIMNIIEAREICKLYLINGKVYVADRFYVITYIIPPALFLYTTLMITIYWTTLF